MKNMRHICGFTLIELLVTVLMASIVLSAGVPSFRNMILNNRQATQSNNLLTSLMIARSEAVKRHSNALTVCPSADGVNCALAGPWGLGWVVFDDVNGDSVAQPAELIRVYEGIVNNGLTLSFTGPGNQVIFFQTGMSTGSAGTFSLCDGRGVTSANGLILSTTGRARRAVDTNGDGIVENGGGGPIPCP